MKMTRTLEFICSALLAVAIATPLHAQQTRTSPTRMTTKLIAPKRLATQDAASIAERVASLNTLSSAFRRTAASRVPAGLTAADRAETQRYSNWLNASAERIDALAAKGERALASNDADQQSSFSLEYLQLQQKMQQENRELTLLSNIMKQKHDSAKKAIDNIR